MSEPLISSICVTGGRVTHLNEALACFLNQSYANKSLVILNTLPAQELVGDFPGVKIINLTERPTSLASARNIAIRHSQGDIICTSDDDDFYLKNFLATFAKHFTDGIDWVHQPLQFYHEAGVIKGIVPGSFNVFAFTRKAFDKLGGYTEQLSVGEDRLFVGRLTQQFHGVKIPENGFAPTFIYTWFAGIEHVSGFGDDRTGRTTAWERARKKLDQRIKAGIIPTGRIELKPELKQDYEKLAADFLANDSKKNSSVGVVCLGKYGDIINLLPILQHISESYAKPTLMINRAFASLLEGVSYVEPLIVDFNHTKLLPAIEYAKEHFQHVIVAQPWALDWQPQRHTDAYNKESWRLSGFLHRFDDPTWFPVFDRRNTARENALGVKLEVPFKPMLLVKLDGSVSSPCPECPKLLEPITERFGQEFNIINLSNVRAERIYDLLGLMNVASAMISVDTALLHLAAASKVPFVALTNPAPWLGTSPRGNCVAHLPYTEALAKPGLVVAAIENAINLERKEMAIVELTTPPIRKIIHCTERHDDPSPSARARKAVALASWERLYAAGVVPIHLRNYPRTARDIGDKRALPYLKDVLQPGLDRATDNDIIILTNDDVILHPDLPEKLLFHASVYGPCSSQRCEFRGRPIPSLANAPSVFALRGRTHIGRDLFCFPKKWLVEKWDQISDYILGASDWDYAMAAMIRLHYGIASTRKNIEDIMHPAEIERGYVIHQWHSPYWMRTDNESKSPSQVWNRKLLMEWARQHLPTLKFDSAGRI